jgi:hypothetical protein
MRLPPFAAAVVRFMLPHAVGLKKDEKPALSKGFFRVP